MKVLTFTFNPIQENTYLLWDETTLEAAIIDCGAYNEGERNLLQKNISENNLQLKYLLQTHMHFDHIYGLPYFAKEYDLSPMCHHDELPIYKAMPQMALQFVGLPIDGELPMVRECLFDGEDITLGNLKIHVIHTPGHTPGGVCFWIEDERLLFSGDTLFQCSLGRADFPGGNMLQEINSIQNRLLTLPKETRVLTGHGPETNIGWEIKNNPYV